MKREKRRGIIDNIIKLIVIILVSFMTYTQYFLVIPDQADVESNKKRIYELNLTIEKYQTQNSVIFDSIISRLERLESSN